MVLIIHHTHEEQKNNDNYRNRESEDMTLNTYYDEMSICDPMDAFNEAEDLLWNVFWADLDNPSSARRSFIFHPSFANTYWELKKINPEWATAYMESLLTFGVDNKMEIPDFPKVKAFLINAIRIIHKQCDKFDHYKRGNRTKQIKIWSEQREHDEEKVSKGFFCYFDYLKMAREILNVEQYKEFLYGFTEICSYQEYESTDPLIRACLEQVIPLVNATDLRYKRNISDGRLGGRKKLFSDEDLIEAITKRGLTTQDELAKFFGCSIRTIARRMASENVKKYYDAHRKKNLRI